MPVIINPQTGRQRHSAWEGNEVDPFTESGDGFLEGNERGTVRMRITETERNLLMHLRMLERGTYKIEVQINAKSMWGLNEFRVIG
jgi:hypothetical protein